MTLVAALLSFSTFGSVHAHAHDLRSKDDCATCRVVHGATLAAPPPSIALALLMRSEPIAQERSLSPHSHRAFVGAPRAPPISSN